MEIDPLLASKPLTKYQTTAQISTEPDTRIARFLSELDVASTTPTCGLGIVALLDSIAENSLTRSRM
jgi:hypothetical protein